MAWQTIVFDLDGTLTDSAPGITRAASYALSQFHIEAPPESLYHLVGPPLQARFMDDYGFSEQDAMQAVRHFRVYYSETGWLENAPYPGIVPMLQALQQAGKHMMVVTSKPERQAIRILEHFDLARYFSAICGPQLTGSELHEKADILRRALLNCPHPLSHCIMVGDRRYDVEAAHKVGIAAVGITYGYGSREELTQWGADYILPTISQLEAFLLDHDNHIRSVRT